MSNLFNKPDALISDCGSYRYWLTRTWNSNLPPVAFIMLNPSTATADIDDPTIRKCVGFAKRWGCGMISVVNLFAYRATDPQELHKVRDPVGPDNMHHLKTIVRHTFWSVGGKVICAWGTKGSYQDQDHRFLRQSERIPLHILGLTKRIRSPKHPLYVPYSITPQAWEHGF